MRDYRNDIDTSCREEVCEADKRWGELQDDNDDDVEKTDGRRRDGQEDGEVKD